MKATKLLKKLFMSFVKVENHIENMKKQLIKRPKFDMAAAFQVLNFDGLERGFDKVSIEEIQGILKKHGTIAFPK